MKQRSLILGALAAAGAVVALSGGRGGSRRSRPSDCPDVDSGETYEYRGVRFKESMKGGADRRDAVPMVFAFHSMGANPSQYSSSGSLSNIGPARVIAPFGKYTSADLGGSSKSNFHWFPSGIKALVKNNTEEQAAAIFMETANWFRGFASGIYQCRPTVGKPVFTGSSMGAEMSYLMNATMPGFSGLTVAVNGFLPRGLWSANISPQLALHGINDNTVPYEWDKEYNETIKKLGAPATFASYESGHGVSGKMAKHWTGAIRDYISRISGSA